MLTAPHSPVFATLASDAGVLRAEVVAPKNGPAVTLPTLAEIRALERKARINRADIVGGWIGNAVGGFVLGLRAAARRWAAMAELQSLDSRMLADIGISRGEIAGAVAGADGIAPRIRGGGSAVPSLNDDHRSNAA